MSIKNNKGFKKGKSGNPSGRPVGVKSSATKSWAEIKKLAINDYHAAYEELRESMQAGEGWAHNLFFKELVPKKLYTDSILISPEDSTPEARVAAITKGLLAVNELTHTEALEELKAFRKLKEVEGIKNGDSIDRVSVVFLDSADKKNGDVGTK
jgi:hypothetical protein